jgi:hypothetical protein
VAEAQLAVSDGLALGLADVDGAPEVSDGLVLAEADPDGDELDGAVLGWALGSLLGLIVGFGGRLDRGGRTWVTSLTTGSGLSGTAEAPSR